MTPLDLLIEALDGSVEEKRKELEQENKINIDSPKHDSSSMERSDSLNSQIDDLPHLFPQNAKDKTVNTKPTSSRSMKTSDWNSYKASDQALTFYNSKEHGDKEGSWMREKHSRLRIAKPLLSQQELDVQMLGKEFIPLNNLKTNLSKISSKQDWTTIGAMFSKQSKKSMKNGKVFSIWRLTDLQGDIGTVTCMLFGRAQQRHYAMPINTVVGLLNPKVMEDRGNIDTKYSNGATLSIEHPDQLLELGYCSDIGTCKAKKKDGGQCNNIVNMSNCDHCTHHLTKAYRALSGRRGDIQSSFSGSEGVRARIMNKIDPKANYFGSGHFLAPKNLSNALITSNASAKQSLKEDALAHNMGIKQSTSVRANSISTQDVQKAMKEKEHLHLNEKDKKAVQNVASDVSAELGLRLLQPTPGARGLLKTMNLQNNHQPSCINSQSTNVTQKQSYDQEDTSKGAKKLLFEHRKMKAEERARTVMLQRANKSPATPVIGKGFSNGQSIDLTAKAVATLRSKGIGSIAKVSPNHVPKRKRSFEEASNSAINVIKRVKRQEERDTFDEKEEQRKDKEKREWINKVVQSKSLNERLVSEHEDAMLEERFDFLEKKEAVETRMMDTKSVETTAVSCSTCNYTAFSQSDFCRGQQHTIQRIKATKRFFACAQCSNRVICLDRYPKHSCSNCFGSKWKRTALMDDSNCKLKPKEQLLVRGKEQKFINQTIRTSDLNINTID